MNFWLCILLMIESSRVSAPGTGDITLLLCTDPSSQRGRESESWGEIGALSLTPGGDSGLLTNQRAGLGAVDQSEAGCRFCRMGHKDGYVTGRNWLLGPCDPCCGWYQVNIMPPFRVSNHYGIHAKMQPFHSFLWIPVWVKMSLFGNILGFKDRHLFSRELEADVGM